MNNTLPKQKLNEGAWLWFVKIVAGLVIVVILAIHYIVNHILAPGGLLSYTDVIAYYQNPLIPIMEFLFLVFVIVHCLIGVRSIFLDLNPSPKTLRFITILLIVLGAIAISYGTWLILFIVRLGI